MDRGWLFLFRWLLIVTLIVAVVSTSAKVNVLAESNETLAQDVFDLRMELKELRYGFPIYVYLVGSPKPSVLREGEYVGIHDMTDLPPLIDLRESRGVTPCDPKDVR